MNDHAQRIPIPESKRAQLWRSRSKSATILSDALVCCEWTISKNIMALEPTSSTHVLTCNPATLLWHSPTSSRDFEKESMPLKTDENTEYCSRQPWHHHPQHSPSCHHGIIKLTRSQSASLQTVLARSSSIACNASFCADRTIVSSPGAAVAHGAMASPPTTQGQQQPAHSLLQL